MSNPGWAYAVEIRGVRGAGQDRAAVSEAGDGLVVALADGAGGTGGGDVAAQRIIDAATTATAPDWPALIEALDRDRHLGGQSTAVLLAVTRDGVRGASVGDSGAWLVRGDQIVDLTEHQQRKPLVGAGAIATPFACGPLDGATLIVASDGLFNYAKRADIARLAQQGEVAEAARVLVELVRLPSGALQDDVSVVLIRA